MDEMNIIVQYAKLWGMETVDARSNKEIYNDMETYDSVELLELFMSWKDEYMKDENADDTVKFFYKKFNSLMKKH